VRALWSLDPSVTFLNHGSFGAAILPALEAQAGWRTEMEREPVDFLVRMLPAALDEARAAASSFLRADPQGFAFVPNATTAISTVLANRAPGPRDRVVITDHSYPAVVKAATKACREGGGELVVVQLPLPLPPSDTIVRAIASSLDDRTRLVIVDHVTSPTAVILPVEEIVRECRRRGVAVLVDAAHSVGMLPVDVDALGADFWTGNFHKWCCAPKGSAALVVGAEHRRDVHPLVTSHGFGGTFQEAFDWTGTADVTAWLSVPAALEAMAALGWDRVRRHNHEVVTYGQRVLSAALGTEPPVPPEAFGSMAIAALPDGVATTTQDAVGLTDRLFEHTRIEVPIVAWNRMGFVRLSAQVYNRPADYDRLAEALPRLL